MAYTTSDEQIQIDEIKQWWKENGKVIIVAVILAIAGVFGWRYWQNYQLGKIHQSSANFSQILAANAANPTADNPQLTQFIQENPDNIYATFLLLDKAKSLVEAKQWEKAEIALTQALSNTKNSTLSSLILLRLANVQTQLKQFEAALATLNNVSDLAWQGRKSMLMGKIYYATGKKEEAKKAFETALITANPLEAQWLQVQLNNL